MENFKVSVIVPVYNAERFLRVAVQSAVSLDEVGEVLLIEDKSVDGSLALCRQLIDENSKTRLLQHPGGENKGAGESRNLGIRNAAYDFVAFLDADDWYLPNRFKTEKFLFDDIRIDGVYAATGFYYEDKQSVDPQRLTTIRNPVTSKELLKKLLMPDTGRFHTNAITIRKSLFQKSGLFDTSLRLHQDTHLWLRLAHFGKLVPGIVDTAVSIRRVHSSNRIQHKNTFSRHLLYKKAFESFKDYDDVTEGVLRLILKKYIASYSMSLWKRVMFAIRLLAHHPDVIKKIFR
jgi:glycosyltransferase involved in cell wall biosynthesis